MKKLLLSLGLCFAAPVFAQDQPENSRILCGMNYVKAFELPSLEEMQKKYWMLLPFLKHVYGAPPSPVSIPVGDANNVASAFSENQQPLLPVEERHGATFEQHWNAFHRDQVAKVLNEKARLIWMPTYQELINLTVYGGIGLGTFVASGSDGANVGGGLGILWTLYSAGQFFRTFSHSVYNRCHIPPHSLDDLEREFAAHQVYLPQEMRPKIIQQFTDGRQSIIPLKHVNDFLRYALDMQIYRPKPPLLGVHWDHARMKVAKKIQKFFKEYDVKEESPLHCITHNVTAFLRQLEEISSGREKQQDMRPLYLKGAGGIGKTHFAHQLAKWINKYTNNAMLFQQVVLAAEDDLEGSAQKPGLLLEALRSLTVSEKHGSLVFIDEIDVNKDPSAAKRTFDATFAKCRSSFLGTHNGNPLELPRPNTLFVLAANGAIEDKALASRFDTVEFPLPKKEALLRYGKKLLTQKVSEAGLLIKRDTYEKSVAEMVDQLEKEKALTKEMADLKLSDESKESQGKSEKKEGDKPVPPVVSFRDIEKGVNEILGRFLWEAAAEAQLLDSDEDRLLLQRASFHIAGMQAEEE